MRRGLVLALVLSACGARTELGGIGARADGGAPEAASDAKDPIDASSPIDASLDSPPDVPTPTCKVKATTAIAAVPFTPDMIVLNEGFAYVEHSKGISRVPVDGTGATPITTAQPIAWPLLNGFVVEDADVAWWKIDLGGKTTTLKRTPKAGGATVDVGKIPSPVYGITELPNHVVALYGDTIVTVTAQGQVTVLAANPPAFVSSLVPDGSGFLVTAESTLYRFENGIFTPIVTLPEAHLVDLKVDGPNAYFFAGADADAIVTVPKTGGTPKTLVTRPHIQLLDFALDATHLYVALRLEGKLLRVDRDTGLNPVVIASTENGEQLIGVAIDEACLYFTGAAGSTTLNHVYATPK